MTIGGGGGSQPQQTTQEVDNTTTQTVEADPFLRGIQKQFLSNIPQLPRGNFVAPLAPQSQGANVLATQFGTDPSTYASSGLAGLSQAYAMSPLVTQAIGNQMQTLSTLADVNNLDPRSNPFTAAAADAANRQTIGTLLNDVLPQIRGGAITAGQFGGSRQGVAEANAVSGAAQAISDTTAKFYFGQYNQNAQQALQAMQQMGATLQLPQNLVSGAINDRNAANQQAMMAIDTLDKAGQQLSGHAQQITDAEVRRFLTNVQIPLDVVRAVGGLTSSSASTTHQTGTTVGSMPAASISPLQGAVGGGLAGASLGSMLGATNPWFAVGGAALGLLSSF